MPHLEPNYLRYIYDGLIKESIHSDNADELLGSRNNYKLT